MGHHDMTEELLKVILDQNTTTIINMNIVFNIIEGQKLCECPPSPPHAKGGELITFVCGSFVFLFDLILYVPVNNLSVTSGRVFLG